MGETGEGAVPVGGQELPEAEESAVEKKEKDGSSSAAVPIAAGVIGGGLAGAGAGALMSRSAPAPAVEVPATAGEVGGGLPALVLRLLEEKGTHPAPVAVALCLPFYWWSSGSRSAALGCMLISWS